MKVTRLLEPLSALCFRVPLQTPGNKGTEEVRISKIVGLNRRTSGRDLLGFVDRSVQVETAFSAVKKMRLGMSQKIFARVQKVNLL